MIDLKYVSLLTLIVQNSMLVLILRYSRMASDYLSTTAVLLCEISKLIMCFVIYLNEKDDKNLSIIAKLKDISHPRHQSWKLAIPATLYAIQNNLQYVAASNLSAASFQVTYQLKILTTALCSVWLLQRQLSFKKWIALFILTAGVACVQYKGGNKAEQGNPVIGFSAVLTACMLSGLAGVYFEKVLKTSKTSLWVRNIQLSAWSLIPASFGCIFVDGYTIKTEGFFINYTHWTVYAIACQALGGLIVAMVVKYADNILKGFATSISIILSSIASIYLFDFQITFLFFIGASLVIYSTYVYGLPDNATTYLPVKKQDLKE